MSLRDRAVSIVEPVYPKEAKRRGIKGHVVVEVMIDEEGSVASTRALTGHRLLREAATKAAKQWKFTPFELNGRPVKLIGSITFSFPAKKSSKKAERKDDR
jgi:protein TonB